MPCPKGSLLSMPNPSTLAGQLDTSLLEDRCRQFMVQGLAPSASKTYSTGQRKFYDFCLQAGKLHPNGSPCPAEEWTLCLFVSFLADSIQHSSMKVSLHIEQGFPDPLLNCLCLQRALRGIKHTQGSLACFGQHALKPILDLYIRQSSQSPIWLPSCLPSI